MPAQPSAAQPARAIGAKRRFRLLGRRFTKSTRGAVAVEFALIAVPFLTMIVAILETALVFYAQFTLDTGLYEAARLIRTGQAQENGFSAATFRNEVCSRTLSMIDCEDTVYVDVRAYDDFGDINLPPPLNGQGEIEDNFGYDDGDEGSIIVARAFYEVQVFSPTAWGIGLGNMASGNRLLSSAATFRNEPFGSILE